MTRKNVTAYISKRPAVHRLIDIQTLAVIEGKLPRRALVMVLEWANEHRAELMEDWNLCQTKQLPKAIKPLE